MMTSSASIGGGGSASGGHGQQYVGFNGPVLEVVLPAHYRSWRDVPANPLLGFVADRPLSEMAKEEFTFYCDSCQRGFFSQRKLDEHMSEHLYCTVDGCRFTTRSQWKLDIHIETLHNRPDAPDLRDTATYLEQRKKRFPTNDTVAAKVEELFYKSSRGELLPDERRRWLRQHGVYVRRPRQEFVYVPIVRGTEGDDEDHDDPNAAWRKRKPDAEPTAEKYPRKEKMLPKGVDGRFTRAQQVQLVRDKYRDAKLVPRFYVCTRCGEKGQHWVTSCPTIGDGKFDRHVIWAEDRSRGGALGPPSTGRPRIKTEVAADGSAQPPQSDEHNHAAAGSSEAAAEAPRVEDPLGQHQQEGQEQVPPPPVQAGADETVEVSARRDTNDDDESAEVAATSGLTNKAASFTSAPTMRKHVPRRKVFLPPKEPTLFDKLVEDERLGDKGLLLQAFRYFTRTNFLQPVATAPQPPASDAHGSEPSTDTLLQH